MGSADTARQEFRWQKIRQGIQEEMRSTAAGDAAGVQKKDSRSRFRVAAGTGGADYYATKPWGLISWTVPSC